MNKTGGGLYALLLSGFLLSGTPLATADTSATSGTTPACIDVTGAPCSTTSTSTTSTDSGSSTTTQSSSSSTAPTANTAPPPVSSTSSPATALPSTSLPVENSPPVAESSTNSATTTPAASSTAPAASTPSTAPATSLPTEPSLPSFNQQPQRGTELFSEPLPQRPENKRTTRNANGEEDDIIYSEILLISDSLQQAEAHRRALQPFGLRIKQRKHLTALNIVLSRFRVPPQQEPTQLMKQLHEQLPDLRLEFNRRYHLLGNKTRNARQYGRRHTGLTNHSGKGITLAMLDAKVDEHHPALADAELIVSDVTGKQTTPSRHGTAVASLLVGTQLVQGALPKAHLLAVNIFTPDHQEQLQTQSHWWLEGLNLVMSSQPQPHAINMSFGGRYSAIIAEILQRLARQNIRLVAAAGNSGADSAVYFPASHPQVVAVTAVDVHQKRYAQAPRQLTEPAVAAPGVDVWAADRNGKGFYATGTSFASPWVTALLGLANHEGRSLNDSLAQAKDLGAKGFDKDYGMGLIHYP
jgi:Subtilase family